MSIEEAVYLVLYDKKNLYISLYSSCYFIQDYQNILSKQTRYIKKLILAKSVLKELENILKPKELEAYKLYYYKNLMPKAICDKIQISERTFVRYKEKIKDHWNKLLKNKIKQLNKENL